MVLRRLVHLSRFFYRTKVAYPRSANPRYSAILELAFRHRCKTILEIGVYTGRRARELIQTALVFHQPDEVRYFGFDLFEQMDSELLESELSKLPPGIEEVRRLLSAVGPRVELYQGFSSSTLPPFVAEHTSSKLDFDLIFIDGGHSLETIRGDWEAVLPLVGPTTLVVFDDYYLDDPELIEKFGCNRVIEGLLDDDGFEVRILPGADSFEKETGVLNVTMAEVSTKRHTRNARLLP